MSCKLVSCLSNLVFICFITCGNLNAETQSIPFNDLFWPQEVYSQITGFQIIAKFEDSEFSSYLVRQDQNDHLNLLTPGQKFIWKENVLTFVEASNQGLLFESERGHGFVLNFNKFKDNWGESTHMAQFASEVISFNKEKLKLVKDLAVSFGVPKIIVDNFNTLPSFGTSRAGRRGWILGEDIPAVFYTFTPFSKGDIVLSVDNIPVTEEERLLNHISKSGKTKKFGVEIQRNKKLKMIQVYIK